jgi:hypothetical protein
MSTPRPLSGEAPRSADLAIGRGGPGLVICADAYDAND